MANTKIPSELIADSSITAAKLADGTITTADIADSNVTTAKIADSNVTTAKIGDAQVTTAKITDANVTTGKIADDAVTTAKMASNSVTSDTIASGITLAGNTTFSGSVITSTLASPDGTGIISLPNTGEASFARGAVFNENSHDSDFRVESNANTHMLFVDAGNNRIGINSATPSETLQVNGNLALYGELKLVQAIRHANSGVQVIDNDNDTYFILNDPEGANRIKLGDSGDASNTYRNTTHKFEPASGTEYMRINATGVGIGTNAPSAKLDVNRGSSGNVASFKTGAANANDYAGVTLHSYTISNVDWYGSEIRSINTASNPSYLNPRLGFFTQDNNTHLPANRTEKMSILGNGNVGIGITTPQEKLHVYTTGTSRVEAEGTTGFAAFKATNNSGSYGWYVDDSADKFHLYDFTDNADRITVDGSGKVGIGTSNPASRLHVDEGAADDCRIIAETHAGGDSMILFSQGASGSGTPTWGVGLDAGSGTSDGFSIGYEDTGYNDFSLTGDTKLVITTAGKVGIGTTNPSTKLTVRNDNSSTAFGDNNILTLQNLNNTDNSRYGIGFTGNTGIGSGLALIEAQSYNSSSGHTSLNFSVYNGSWHSDMMVLKAGKVGIGTANPSTNLDVYNGSGWGTIHIDGTSGGELALQKTGTRYGGLYASNSHGLVVEAAGGTNTILFLTSSSEKMRINATGHLTFNPVSGFSGLNNSLLGSSNGYMYAMGGTAGLYLADNSDLSNAIGIRNDNYIDFTASGTSILKFDGDGIHFQKTDGQKISAKESIVMQVDADNNTASRVFQVTHGNGKTLLNLHDDYRMEVGTIQFSSTRSAGYSSSNGLGASAGDWVDIAAVPYGRNIATIKLFWDAIYAPSSSHHGNMEFDIGSHYGTSYYYGWDSYINLKASSAHNSFFISEARIITPNGSGATGHFQVKFGVATGTNGTLRAYVTHRDEQCSIDPITPVVNNSRSGTTIASVNLEDRPSLAASRNFHTKGMMRATAQPAFSCNSSGTYTTTTGDQNIKTFASSNATTLNQGSDLSGGKFTAPVDGLYQFNLKGAATYSSGYLFMYVFKNGSAMSNAYHYMFQTSNSATLSFTVKADAGDYFEPYINTNYSGGSVSAILFSGHLIA